MNGNANKTLQTMDLKLRLMKASCDVLIENTLDARITMTTQTATVVWQTIEFTKKGPESVYVGTDFEKARSLYDTLEHGTFVELHGRDERGQFVPNGKGGYLPCQNIFLGRKAHGVEQLDK